MSQEHPPQPAPRRPYEVFGLTEQEVLNWRVSEERFEKILDDEGTQVHTIKDSSNNYGEFLFVTTSRVGDQGRICMTFFGLGFHQFRERWFTNEWFWYQAQPYPEMLSEKLTKEEADEMLQQRMEQIQPHVKLDTQTERGRLFELLADLTDEDGALAEMEDLDNLKYLFSGDTG